MDLKEVVIPSTGAAIRRTRSEVPDYLRRAISDSVERGKHDASRSGSTQSAAKAAKSGQERDRK
jgi:hypothetical protein